jgi:putative transposase
MADHTRAELVVEALQMALWQRRPLVGLVHHSDRAGNTCR